MPPPDAPTLPALRGLAVLDGSLVVEHGVEWALADTDDGRGLVVLAREGAVLPETLEGERDGALLVGPLSAANAAAVRQRLAWLRPRTFGLRGSFGFGDRLGIATPGHVRALRATGSTLAPILAQQSIRELDRSGRDARQVVDAATWGAFAEGWREGYGADADHLKTLADVDRCAPHGYTLYTIDPGDHVDSGADAADGRQLEALLAALPWERLRDHPRDLAARYAAEGEVSPEEVARAAAKYGRALAHVAEVYDRVRAVAPDGGFEVEVSVDETEAPTTPAQHVYIATELRRLGVEWVSLAPRFVGRFEKGIDYIGDVGAFADDIAVHAAIAERLGPYKLSLHSGSDKLAIYPAFAGATRGRMHVKTSGTSYLEALRTVAREDPGFVRRVYAFACERFAEDRASYHVAVDLAAAPRAAGLDDEAVPALLDDDDARRILHVTFGSVLQDALGTELGARLDALSEQYAAALERHFVRHLEPLA
jgi:tagaturonate epimerase